MTLLKLAIVCFAIGMLAPTVVIVLSFFEIPTTLIGGTIGGALAIILTNYARKKKANIN
jgi:hypothetical protein